jgi:transglutaminase/protease-like cytokinesis protein 3
VSVDFRSFTGKDYLLDVTWGSGYLDSGSGRFVSRLDMAWWCRAPAEMIKTHLPDQARWQLLPKQVACGFLHEHF